MANNKSPKRNVKGSTLISAVLTYNQDNVLHWDVEDVSDWLRSINLERLRKDFEKRKITGKDLLRLGEEELIAFQIVKFSDHKELRRNIEKLVESHRASSPRQSMVDDDSSSCSSRDSDKSPVKPMDTTTSSSVVVKCYFKEDIHQFKLSKFTIEHLRECIHREYGQHFAMKFKDQEHEVISIKSTAGVVAAVSTALNHFNGVLKLHLTPINSVSEAEEKLLDDMLVPVVVIDAKGHIVYANSESESLFSRTKSSLLQRKWKTLFSKSEEKQLNEELSSYLTQGMTNFVGGHKGKIVTCKNSEKRHFPARLTLSETKCSERKFFVATFYKMGSADDFESFEEASKRFEILDLLSDPTLVFRENGKIIFSNSQVESILGFKKEDLYGQSTACLIPDAFRSSTAVERDVPVKTKEGKIMLVHLKLTTKVIDGRGYFTAVMFPKNPADVLLLLRICSLPETPLNDYTVPVLGIDGQGKVTSLNVAFSKFFGYSVDDLNNISYQSLLQSTQGQEVIDDILDSTPNKETGKKVVVKRKDGVKKTCVLYVTEKFL